MDVAVALDRLVPGAAYGGSLTDNTREAFDALRWEDDRAKPSWSDVEAAWVEIQAEPEAASADDVLADRIQAVYDAAPAGPAKDLAAALLGIDGTARAAGRAAE